MIKVTQQPFLYISPLSEDGSFDLPLPHFSVENSLRVEVQRLCTYLPVPDQDNDANRTKSTVKDKALVKKLELNTDYLIGDSYCFKKYFDTLKESKGGFDASVTDIYQGMWVEGCDPFKMFDPRIPPETSRETYMLNDIYNYFQTMDVVLFLEYGLHMNTNSRVASMKSLRNSQPPNDPRNLNFGLKNFQACVYGFNVNYKFVASETHPDISNSYFWTKLTNEVEEFGSDFSILDMIRYAFVDFGGYEFFKLPTTANFSLKRQGYGLLLQFPELDTFLCLTVTAGRLPYVVDSFDDNSITLSDRDYADVNPSQRFAVLRKTESLLRPEVGEYQLEYYSTLNRYLNRDYHKDSHSLSTRLNKQEVDLNIDFIFDCPLNTEPMCDVKRYGLSNMLPVHGGFSLIYWIFFVSLYYVGALRYEMKNFFVTPNLLMNFIGGNALPYDVGHAMYPYHRDADTDLNPMPFLVNPEVQTFLRILFMIVKRNRSFSERVKDVLSQSHMVIGVEMFLGHEKLVINNATFVRDYIQQAYFQSAEEFPSLEIDSSQGSMMTIVKSKRNIVITDPFTSTVNLNTNILKPIIQLKFYGYDETLKRKSVTFSKGDKIIIKGQFVWLS